MKTPRTFQREETEYSANRRRAADLVWAEMEDGAHIVLGVTPQTGRRFVEAIKEGREEILHHGNLGRHRYEEAFQAARAILALEPRGTRLRPDAFREFLEKRGIPAPSERTIRRWMAVEFRARRRKTKKRKRRRVRK